MTPLEAPATRALTDREWISFQLAVLAHWPAAERLDDAAWIAYRDALSGSFTSQELERAVAELATNPWRSALPGPAVFRQAARPLRRLRYRQWWEAHA